MEKLIEPPELAERISIPERTLAQWRYLGRGPAFVKIGRHVRYRESAIDEWLTDRTRGALDD